MGAKFVGERLLSGRRKAFDLDLSGVPVRISDSTGADQALEKSGPHIGLHHLGLGVENLDEAVADLKSHGVEFVVEPHRTRPGIRVAFIRAPENVLIELTERS
jgi:catechol 2,3-dioxygenase-like lactoylglutathione lyase family enzyme